MTEQLPNLALVGVAKGGTTSLFHNQDIRASPVKEPDYCAPLRVSGGRLAPLEEFTRLS